jgi:hypothetical protein
MSSDSAVFLAARLDEDEQRAQAAMDDHTYYWVDIHGDLEWIVTQTEGDFAKALPKRWLAEVEAKRAVLARLEAIPHRYVEDCYYSCELAIDPDDPEQRPGSGYCNNNWPLTGGCTCGRDDLVASIEGALAAVYRDHPDWKP